MGQRLKFPGNFLWGSATSAHQVEGGNFNDWSKWAHKNADEKASVAEEKNWPEYILNNYPSPKDRENYISGKACDHYHVFDSDFDLAKNLGQNAHRFSIEWSRIEPKDGEFDEFEIEHYRKVLLALKTRDIEPFVTLHHFTNPVWFAEKGGWEQRNAPRYFARYAERVFQEFGGLVKFWITINEPTVLFFSGYLSGQWPPRKKDIFGGIRAFLNLIEAHKNTYQFIKKYSGETTKVGIAHNIIYFEPYRNKILNKVISFFADYFPNKYLLHKIKDYQDFIGLNYYFHRKIRVSLIQGLWREKHKREEATDLDWEIYPRGIYNVLKVLGKYNVPIYITENGLADAKDEKRENFITDHLKMIHKAIEEGIDVRGYFHWSLIDNFEWDKGFWPRFGLIEVDYKTMERKIRPSAMVYAKICKENIINGG